MRQTKLHKILGHDLTSRLTRDCHIQLKISRIRKLSDSCMNQKKLLFLGISIGTAQDITTSPGD
jgi:hypothetical protein